MNHPRLIPPVVSKRNDFSPADEFVENALPFLPDPYKQPDFRAWLMRYTESVIKGIASHFGVAASRGIEQAAELLCDPEFYETRRQRRAKERRNWQEQQAKQEWDRIEALNCPTAEQLARQIRNYEQQLAYHETEVEKCQASLERLRACTPKNIRLVPSNRPN